VRARHKQILEPALRLLSAVCRGAPGDSPLPDIIKMRIVIMCLRLACAGNSYMKYKL
jgi:hypothetical protein